MSGSAPPSAPVGPGDILAGKYCVERVLGVGGMGVVVAARHVQLGQHVALKFLHGASSHDPTAVERFLREARAVVLIQSEHVARVSDVGTLESGAPYIVMEFLDGTDLDGLLANRGPLPVETAIDYVLQSCCALAEAHKAGIVHRDLKPANLFLTRRSDGSPLIKVLDFGISKLQSEGASPSPALTSTSAMFGSPLYMSPEQMRSSKRVDHRTDIWALGVIMHELLTATRVFEADTFPGLVTAIATDPPARLRDKVPSAPPELELAILRCLEKDPTRRFANVADLADAIAPFAPHCAGTAERVRRILGVAATSSPPASVVPPGGAPTPARADTVDTGVGWGKTGTPSAKGSRAPFIAAAVVGCLVLGAGGAYFSLRDRSSTSGATAPSASMGSIASSSAAAPSPPAPSTTTAPVPSAIVELPAVDAGPAPVTSAATPTPTPVANAKKDRPPRPAPARSAETKASPPAGDKGYDDRK